MEKGGLYSGAGSEWDESEHPRDEDGKFANKNTTENRSFITIQLFAANYSNQTDAQLLKSRKSNQKNIAEHQYKISNPEKFYHNWNNMPEIEKKGRILQWEKEIRNYQNQIKLIEKELKKRGKKNGS